MRRRFNRLGTALVPFLLILARPAIADYVLDVGPNPQPPFNTWNTVFPNWVMVPTSSFMITECDDVACAWCMDSPIVGLTMFNYGTASGGATGDITGMYFQVICNGTNSGLQTLTYAGDWTEGPDTFPAWTWAGSIPWAGDPCQAPGGAARAAGAP